jgi:hypothetical protein
MAWFQRGRDPAVTPRDPDPDEEKAALLNDLLALRGYLNRHADQLPTVSVVTAHQIGDVLRGVLDAAGDRPLDAHTAVRLSGFLTDYVPTTVRSFLAVSTDRDSAGILQEQLASLLDEAGGLAASARSYDTDALLTQGTFLRTKFSRSDLDL